MLPILGVAYLLFGESRPALKLAGIVIFGAAVYLQFYSRFSTVGLVMQVGVAVCLVLWRKWTTAA